MLRRDSADLSAANTYNGSNHSSNSSNTALSTKTPAQLADNKAKLLEIRLFVDGMHEYILAHRGISLAILYEQEKQRYIINSDAQNAAGGAVTGARTFIVFFVELVFLYLHFNFLLKWLIFAVFGVLSSFLLHSLLFSCYL